MKAVLANLSEQDKFRLNIYHEYDDLANLRKLQHLYGKVVQQQNVRILDRISGGRVLDVGAGYGTLAKLLQDSGLAVVALDPNVQARELARQWYDIKILPGDIHFAPFADASFDTAILREVVEHLDFERTVTELHRIITREVIIFQSNLTWEVRGIRWLIGHHEFNAHSLAYYARLLREAGFRLDSIEFSDVFALPLSGGVLTRQWCPHQDWLEERVLGLDKAATRLCRRFHLAPFFCWRYLLYATRSPP